MLSLALLRPSSRLRASVVATATAEPFPPQRFGPDRPLELGGCACAVASGSAGGELLRLRGLFDDGTLDALLAAAERSPGHLRALLGVEPRPRPLAIQRGGRGPAAMAAAAAPRSKVYGGSRSAPAVMPCCTDTIGGTTS